MPDTAAHETIAETIRGRLARQADHSTVALRKLRREFSRELRNLTGAVVLRIAERLVKPGSGCPRWFACELVHHHKDAMTNLTPARLDRLGMGLSDWGEVDAFAVYLLGPAWRQGQVSNAQVKIWARSKNRWRRRAALVSTVALNTAARGGTGDVKRTLAMCDQLLDDRADMVVKALSWALRALAVREPARVLAYIELHEDRLAARVLREVRNKLRTGLKNPAQH